RPAGAQPTIVVAVQVDHAGRARLWVADIAAEQVQEFRGAPTGVSRPCSIPRLIGSSAGARALTSYAVGSGSQTWSVVLFPGSDSTWAVPPSNSARSLTAARPIPSPLPMFALSKPGPWSEITSWSRPATSRIRACTPLPQPCRVALDRPSSSARYRAILIGNGA